MTSELKCPFCQTELEQVIELSRGGHILGCPKCKRNTDDIFWFALIQAKKDLEIARKALKPFADRDNWDFEHCFVDNPQLLAETALKQIEHKE